MAVQNINFSIHAIRENDIHAWEAKVKKDFKRFS